MAVVVRITCPLCGDVVTDTDHVGLVIDLTSSAATFAARCPQCECTFTQHLDQRETANRLIRGGALYSTIG